MTILPDGRWKLAPHEIKIKIWTKLTGWKLQEPIINEEYYLVPCFPECRHRKLIAICQPCGRVSALNYHCPKKESFVSVNYCIVCASRNEHE